MKNISYNTYHIFFSNLANQLKINIALSLREREKSVTELTQILEVEQSKVSHALRNLKNCKLVEVKKDGKQRIYFLNKKTFLPMLKLIDLHAKNFCEHECCIGKGCGNKLWR